MQLFRSTCQFSNSDSIRVVSDSEGDLFVELSHAGSPSTMVDVFLSRGEIKRLRRALKDHLKATRP